MKFIELSVDGVVQARLEPKRDNFLIACAEAFCIDRNSIREKRNVSVTFDGKVVLPHRESQLNKGVVGSLLEERFAYLYYTVCQINPEGVMTPPLTNDERNFIFENFIQEYDSVSMPGHYRWRKKN